MWENICGTGTHALGRGRRVRVGRENGLAVHAASEDDQDHDAEELGGVLVQQSPVVVDQNDEQQSW